MALDEVVAWFGRHQDAQDAIDRLAHHKFPVEQLAIVGEDVRFVERVTGRLGLAKLALIGAVGGGFLGGLIGLAFGLALLTLPGLVIGALIGAAVAPALHASRSGHDYSSRLRHESGRYALVAEADVASDARRLLAELEEQTRARRSSESQERADRENARHEETRA